MVHIIDGTKEKFVSDIDDVLNCHTNQVLAYRRREWFTNDIPLARMTSLDFVSNCLGTSDEVKTMLSLFMRNGGLRNDTPVHGAREALETIARHYEVHIITSRPLEYMEDTLRWLKTEFNGTIYAVHFARNVHSFASKDLPTKGEIAAALNASIATEDCMEYMKSYERHGIPTIAKDQPWNRLYTGPRFSDYKELPNLVYQTVRKAA